MKVIDLHRSKKSFEDKLSHIEKTLDFGDFKELIAYCLEHKRYNCNDLLSLWNKQKENFANGDCFWSLCDLLKRIRIVYQEEEAPRTSSNARSQAVQNLIQAVVDVENLIEERKEDYSWFSPSHYIRDLLDEYYPEELNPGKVIAKNLNLLFPKNYSAEYLDLVTDYNFIPYADCYILPYDTPLYNLIRKAYFWSLKNTVQDVIALKCYESCLLDLLDPENREKRPRKVELIDIFLSLQLVPHEFFSLWIHHCLLSESTISSLPELRLDELKAALLCFAFGRGNKPLIERVNGHAKLLRKYNKLLPNTNEHVENNCLSFTNFFNLLFRATQDGVITDDECADLIRQLINNISEHRHRYFSGVAPFNYFDAGIMEHLITECIGIADCDLLVLLSGAGFDRGELHLLDDREGALFQDQADFYNEKQHTYLQLFEKAHAEGNHELGTALLSLYIITRFVLAKGSFGNLPELLDAIGKALTLPGAKILKHTLAIVIDSVDRHFSDNPVACCVAMQFRQHLPQGGELRVLPGGKGREGGMPLRSKEDVRSFLIQKIGNERWDKLSKSSQDSLVDAEIQWKNNALEFCFDITDWSGLVMTYWKAIEGEIVERLNAFYCCDAYKEYLIGKGIERKSKATAGWLLTELRGYEKLPQNLKTILSQARIKLHNNLNLVNSLYNISQSHRNIAAHNGTINVKLFTEFKQKLFQDGLLHQFIDAFCEEG